MIARAHLQRQPAGWRDSLKSALRSPAELLDYLGLPVPPAGDPGRDFPMLVPRDFAARMRPGDARDPLLRQVLPVAAEDVVSTGFSSDPVGDLASRAGGGLLHKYRGRVLVVTTGACAVHCRYCFRREFPYAGTHAGRDGPRLLRRYVQTHPDIEEVILSGGDPLMLDDHRLHALSDSLRDLPNIRRLRLHTRMPVVMPDRVDAGLLRWISSLEWPVVMVIHANHAAEFSDSVDRACARLRRHGVHLLNQTVLLRGINDHAGTLADLARRGLDAGVMPYYLHLLDRVAGSAHFEVSDACARAIMHELRVSLSGYLVPRLVREVAGQPYKLPVL